MYTRIDKEVSEKAKAILKERNLTCVGIVRQLFRVLIENPSRVINTLYTDI